MVICRFEYILLKIKRTDCYFPKIVLRGVSLPVGPAENLFLVRGKKTFGPACSICSQLEYVLFSSVERCTQLTTVLLLVNKCYATQFFCRLSPRLVFVQSSGTITAVRMLVKTVKVRK
jgi:hypothetical protein